MSSSAAPRPQPSDQATRARVVERLDSFLVQAPAGAGKTELLVQRFLRLLADERVEEPEAVVAITFTRKAAAEMRNRVLQALAAPEGSGAEWAARARARDRERGWNLLENPARLHISTVDAFCAEVVQRSPLAAGLGAPLRILDDFEALYPEAARRTVRRLAGGGETAAAIARLLRTLDNSLPRFEQQVAEMLQRREQWMRLLDDPHQLEPTALRAKLEAAFADVLQFELARLRERFEAAFDGNSERL